MNLNDMLFDLLYNTISDANVPHGSAELSRMTGIPTEDIQPLLEKLLAEGRIAVSRKGKYALPEKLGLLVGRVIFTHNGSPVFRCDDGETSLRMDEPGRQRTLPEDRVFVRATGDDRCALEAIISRGKKNIAACVRIEHSRRARRNAPELDRIRATAVACDRRIPYAIELDGDISFLRSNELALLAIDEYPSAGRPIRAHAERVLGSVSSLLARMRASAEEHGFPTEFSSEVEMDAAQLRREALPQPDESRADLRKLMLFTIDGASSKDFDDAVSIEKTDNGYRLGVHIADVSYYVRPGSAIDKEALARGTSLYLPGCTVPMLPEILSNDLCSLMPDADRLAMSLFMDISDKGKVTDHFLTPSIIRSKARLTYSGVNRFFDGADEEIAEDVRQALLEMRELAGILRKRRKERGTIDFEMEEAEFVLNEKYEPTEILCPERGESERLIEDFMLLANETVARLAKDTMLPFLYRIHENPDPDRIKALEKFLTMAGAPVHLGEKPHPGMLQKVLDQHQDDEMIEVLRRHMLRALKKAQYSEKPVGHYALSMEDYCHFTSPIRRYPDLMVHRMLKLLLSGGSDLLERWEKRMPELAAVCSSREQESVKAERETEAMLKAAWMRRQLGRKFYGTISGVTGWGVYVTLPNTVEGLVHVSDMDDFFNYDERNAQLIGSGTGIVLQLGMQVRVRAIDASIERGEINFELVD